MYVKPNMERKLIVINIAHFSVEYFSGFLHLKTFIRYFCIVIVCFSTVKKYNLANVKLQLSVLDFALQLTIFVSSLMF